MTEEELFQNAEKVRKELGLSREEVAACGVIAGAIVISLRKTTDKLFDEGAITNRIAVARMTCYILMQTCEMAIEEAKND